MGHIHPIHRPPVTAIALAIGLILLLAPVVLMAAPTSAPPGGMPFKDIELLEPLPGGVTAIGFTGGTHPLEPLNKYLRPFLPWAIGTAGGICILMVIIGGFQIMMAGGDQAGQSAGKDRIKAAIIGLMILILSAVILNFLNASYFLLCSTPPCP